MNKNSEAVSNHTQEIANMKQKLEDQSLKIKSLEKKVTSKGKADKLSILKITGLKKNETEAIHTFLQLAKEKLEVPLNREDFTIRLIRPGTSKIPSIHAVQLHSLWKRKQIYQARSKSKETSIYLAENLIRQDARPFSERPCWSQVLFWLLTLTHLRIHVYYKVQVSGRAATKTRKWCRNLSGRLMHYMREIANMG